jgi:hypothetical protein
MELLALDGQAAGRWEGDPLTTVAALLVCAALLFAAQFFTALLLPACLVAARSLLSPMFASLFAA